MTTSTTLIVCDVQPDVVNKLGPSQGRLWVDLVALVVQATRQAADKKLHTRSLPKIVWTQLHYANDTQLSQISASHKRLGVLRKLSMAGKTVSWFTNDALSIAPAPDETVVRRTRLLPHATDQDLLDALSSNNDEDASCSHNYLVVGYLPTVQAMCHILGDLVCPQGDVQLMADGAIHHEDANAVPAFLQHGLWFREQVLSMTDYLESLDLLHQPLTLASSALPSPNKYVCDVGRGGHLMLYLHYLKKNYEYIEWPIQPWYQEQKSLVETKQYYCPLGRRVVDLCDEPQFGRFPRFFLMGRHYLDEKDQLYQLVPELMPPTFASIAEAQQYQEEHDPPMWFIKKVNQNGGRAVQVQHFLPLSLEEDDQLQAHIPRPLLWDTKKCHVKTYQWIGCVKTAEEGRIEWRIYQHDLYYLAIADEPWSPHKTSDEVQITTMRRQRLYRENPWRQQWNLTQLCHEYLQTIMKRVIGQGKLQVPEMKNYGDSAGTNSFQTLQFEIHSADWILDQDGRMYLIECNGIPVLYDPGQKQPLLTRGLRLYDGLYQASPDTAIVDDHDLIQEAVQLAMKGTLPPDSLWKHLLTVPVVGEGVAK